MIWNNGAADLHVTGASLTDPAFSTDLLTVILAPGDTLEFQVHYDGSPGNASDKLYIYSDDPDENPYPLQVFGRTPNLDPGEQATDFSLPLYSRDYQTGAYSWETVSLSDQLGKIIWFQVYGSW